MAAEGAPRDVRRSRHGFDSEDPTAPTLTPQHRHSTDRKLHGKSTVHTEQRSQWREQESSPRMAAEAVSGDVRHDLRHTSLQMPTPHSSHSFHRADVRHTRHSTEQTFHVSHIPLKKKKMVSGWGLGSRV
eukprot:2450033-Rhodomonas_salina.1